MVAAGFTGTEAEELRCAFGFKRSERRMAEIETKLRAGMARQGIHGRAADEIVHAITAFALYGFPECVSGDTEVIDADTGARVPTAGGVGGRVPMTRTLACDRDLRLVPRRIVTARASGRRLVYRLRTAGGREVLATPEHPLRTPLGWRGLGALRQGEEIAAGPGGVGTSAEWDRITRIEPLDFRETYDLEIEGEPNFVANGLVVHNSHASSFALLAYASAWLKVRHPAAFYAALLNNQPMGFYHAATIVKDAQRHGLVIHPIDVTRSQWDCTIEGSEVRLGLRYVKGLRETAGRALVAARAVRPFPSVADVLARAGLAADEAQTLAAIGALTALGGRRRADLWSAAVAPPGPLFAAASGEAIPSCVSPLREMDSGERLAADYAGSGVTLGPHPMALRRRALVRQGVTRAVDLRHH